MTLAVKGRASAAFVNGPWRDGTGGIVEPALLPREDRGAGLQGYRFAFFTDLPYGDLRARMQLCHAGHSDVGLIFRAQSRSRFSLIHFPCCGQAFRAQHFWVALSRMDESGYLKLDALQMVRRVNSMVGVWHELEVEIAGGGITAVIDGRGRFEADGLDRARGCIGLALFGGARIRGVELLTRRGRKAAWSDEPEPPANWSLPVPDASFGKWQMPATLLRTPRQDLLLCFAAAQGPGAAPSSYLARSRDNGRTWAAPKLWWRKEELWAGHHRVPHVFPDGRLRSVSFQEGLGAIAVSETPDDGESWSEARKATIGELPAHVKLSVGPQAFCNLSDGSTLLLLYGRHDSTPPGSSIYSWGSTHCQAFVSRSVDGGYTWSAPVSVDGTTDPAGGPVAGNMDLTEVCAVEVEGGEILAFARPIYSPWMWEARSHDRGQSWEPCVRGPFPGYAAPNMLRTKSGVIVVAHRLPGLTVNLSPDGGRSWDRGTLIDSAIWAMGCMLEVEDDTVLYVYWDSFESHMRAQRFRVSAAGLQPCRP